MTWFKWPALVLCVFLVFFGALFQFSADGSWQRDLSLNLVAEIVGILATVLLIDVAVRRHSEAERKRVRALVMTKLAGPLGGHMHVLLDMYKAACSTQPQHLPATPVGLFTETFFADLARLDLSAPAPGIPPYTGTWADRCAHEAKKFPDELGTLLDRYLAFLEVEEVELLESLMRSSLLAYLSQVPRSFVMDRVNSWQRTYNLLEPMNRLVRDHAELLKRIVKVHDSVRPAAPIRLDVGIWRQDIAPGLGSARVSDSASAASTRAWMGAGLPPASPHATSAGTAP